MMPKLHMKLCFLPLVTFAWMLSSSAIVRHSLCSPTISACGASQEHDKVCIEDVTDDVDIYCDDDGGKQCLYKVTPV